MKKQKSSFRDKIGKSRENDKNKRSGFGYLNLPKGVSMMKIDEATVYDMDFLPYLVTDDKHPDRDEDQKIALKGEQWYRRPFMIHRNMGPDKDTVVCPKSFGDPCPICEHLAERRKVEDVDEKEIQALRPSMRNLYLVIPKNHAKLKKEIHIWDYSRALFQDQLDEELQVNEENGDFPDLEQGKTLKVRFKEKSLGKWKFYEASRVDFDTRKKYKESILEDVPNLDEVLKVHPYKKLQKMVFDFESVDTDESDVKEIKKSKKNRKAKDGKKSKEKCPEGHKFGKDTDDHKACDKCKIWDKCSEAKGEK